MMLTTTVYLELQEIKANAEAILFSVSQLEAFMSEHEREGGGSANAVRAEGRDETPTGTLGA